jgi:charged multivesicular body protein 2A
MMDDALDDALGEAGEEEETDAVVQQVLDELGIQMGEELRNLPTADGALGAKAAVDAKQPQAAAISSIDADLQARLENLRRE